MSFLYTDRVPGQIETLTDLLLEDFKSFGTCQELGEESARFIRHELETTWGSSHLAVLDEQEAQKWLLGVGTLFSLPPPHTNTPTHRLTKSIS